MTAEVRAAEAAALARLAALAAEVRAALDARALAALDVLHAEVRAALAARAKLRAEIRDEFEHRRMPAEVRAELDELDAELDVLDARLAERARSRAARARRAARGLAALALPPLVSHGFDPPEVRVLIYRAEVRAARAALEARDV